MSTLLIVAIISLAVVLVTLLILMVRMLPVRKELKRLDEHLNQPKEKDEKQVAEEDNLPM